MTAEVVDNDKGWKRLLAVVEALKGGSYAKVGVLADEAKGGLHVPGGKLTVAEIAAVMEYGTQDGKIPARPFLRMTFDEQAGEHTRVAKLLILKIIDGNMPVGQALGLLGAKLAAEVKKRVTSGSEIPPHNAPSVVARKEKRGAWNAKGKAQRAPAAGGGGFGVRTLVDTGRMIGAVTWKVVMGGKSD